MKSHEIFERMSPALAVQFAGKIEADAPPALSVARL
jgi:hypothetical protein